LLAHKANVDIKDKSGHTVLQYALLFNDQEMIKILRAHGAK